MKTRTPAEVFPPGEFIRDELEARGWTQDVLARIMGRPQTALNLIINDKRGVTPETAAQLSGAFGTSPEFWLNLDNAYRLSKVAVPVEEIRKRAARYESAAGGRRASATPATTRRPGMRSAKEPGRRTRSFPRH